MKYMNIDSVEEKHTRRARWRAGMLALALCVVSQSGWTQAPGQRHFASPQEGVEALVKAAEAHDMSGMKDIMGPEGDRLVNSGDEVADKKSRDAFVRAYKDGHHLVKDGEGQVTLVIGKDEWPLPIPLVKSGKGWYFDTDKGDDEILARRIGRNEISAVKVLLEIVDAEREYAALNRGDDGVPVYAARIISTHGKRDGLYWPIEGGDPLSPIGELVAAAAAEGYVGTEAMQIVPYHGYLYRILDRQGKDARGEEQSYVEDGRMTRGFAAIAWPARYGSSGIMTFMVSHEGLMYQKNLGHNTAEVAAAIDSFNPDAGWKPVDPPAP